MLKISSTMDISQNEKALNYKKANMKKQKSINWY